MFSVPRRGDVAAELLRWAHVDPQIAGAAQTGSRARGAADRWSDIDLFLGMRAAAEPAAVISAWTDRLYAQLGAVHHFELTSGSSIYRAFLLADGLEVDLGFAPHQEFGADGEGAFVVAFGEPRERVPNPPRNLDHLAGLCWHHALHARAAIERHEPWQAEYWITALRTHLTELSCARHGLDSYYGKGAQLLPADERAALADALVRGLDDAELRRAYEAAVTVCLGELGARYPERAGRFAAALS